MKPLLGLLMAFTTPEAAAGPVPVTVIDGFSFRGWEVTCSGLRGGVLHCNAIQNTPEGCLDMSFNSTEAYVSLRPQCAFDVEGPRKALQLPLRTSNSSVSDAVEDLMTDRQPRATQLSPEWLEDVDSVAALLHKITNEPTR